MAIDIWDHATDTWSTAALSQRRKKPEAVAAGTKIVIAGGEIAKNSRWRRRRRRLDYTSVVDIFDVVTREWTTAKLSLARQYFGAAGIGDLAIFAGGFYDDVREGVVDIYNARTGTWSVAQPLSAARSNLHATVVAGRYAVFGGGTAAGVGRSSAIDVFDAQTGSWAATNGSMCGAPYGIAGVGQIALFAGGVECATHNVTARVAALAIGAGAVC